MTGYKKIDMETWARREHYEYYTKKLKVEYNMTVNIDVKKVLDFCHEKGYKFYPVMIYLTTKTLNRIENFRMFKDQYGYLCAWDKIVPNYTIFHEDDHTFSDCWTDFSEDFDVFYQNVVDDMKAATGKKGIKAKEGQPANFYCISCTPWMTFTGYGSRVSNGEPSFFPIILMGKYKQHGEKMIMPVNITIAHAVADGYHVGLFFQYLEEEINNL